MQSKNNNPLRIRTRMHNRLESRIGILYLTTRMKLFRRHTTPEDLGARLYEALRSGLESKGDLSSDRLLESIDLSPETLDENYRGEVIVGLMFAAVLAVERSATPRLVHQITAGMKAEFLSHLEEQGASPLQRAEWENVLAARFLDYRKSLEEYTGFEPPWKLGRAFYWNILGEEAYMAMAIKIATLYLSAARDHCQQVLNEEGPYLLPDRTPPHHSS